MLAFLHKTHKLTIIRRETSDKSQLLSGDSPQTALALLFNTVKVFKKQKRLWETVTSRKFLKGHNDSKLSSAISYFGQLFIKWYLCSLTVGKGKDIKDFRELIWKCKRCGFNPWVRKIPWRRKWPLATDTQNSPAFALHVVWNTNSCLYDLSCHLNTPMFPF